jgi:hypothetical protein
LKSSDLVGEANQDRPWFKRKKIMIPLVLVALIIIGSIGGGKKSPSSSSGSTPTTSTQTATRVYPSSVDGSAVVNPATLAVRFTVRNDGSQPVTPSCDLRAQDTSGTYSGFDLFTLTAPLAAGAMQHLVGDLTITKQGAAYATQITVKCSAETSDTSISQGKTVTVVDVSDCGFGYGAYDSDNKTWYWGACAKASGVAPNTQMTCTQVGLDSAGKELARNTYTAVALNDLTITSYGQDQNVTLDTTKAIAKAIKSIQYTCELN